MIIILSMFEQRAPVARAAQGDKKTARRASREKRF
jgi:hypothetical protein